MDSMEIKFDELDVTIDGWTVETGITGTAFLRDDGDSSCYVESIALEAKKETRTLTAIGSWRREKQAGEVFLSIGPLFDLLACAILTNTDAQERWAEELALHGEAA